MNKQTQQEMEGHDWECVGTGHSTTSDGTSWHYILRCKNCGEDACINQDELTPGGNCIKPPATAKESEE